jgi:hypothetical protein
MRQTAINVWAGIIGYLYTGPYELKANNQQPHIYILTEELCQVHRSSSRYIWQSPHRTLQATTSTIKILQLTFTSRIISATGDVPLAMK